MVQNSEKTYGQLMQEAAAMTDDRMEAQDLLNYLLKRLNTLVEEAAQAQHEVCLKKDFSLPKYYLHVMIPKDLFAANVFDAPNTIYIKPHCRVTRPSPYQDADHYLWSIENYNKIDFQWCIPNKEIMNYILKNPHEFDINYVKMLKDFTDDKLEKIDDYLVDGKVI